MRLKKRLKFSFFVQSRPMLIQLNYAVQLKLNKSLSVNFFKYLKFIQLRSNKLKVRPRKIKQDQKCLKFIFLLLFLFWIFLEIFSKVFQKKKVEPHDTPQRRFTITRT